MGMKERIVAFVALFIYLQPSTLCVKKLRSKQQQSECSKDKGVQGRVEVLMDNGDINITSPLYSLHVTVQYISSLGIILIPVMPSVNEIS